MKKLLREAFYSLIDRNDHKDIVSIDNQPRYKDKPKKEWGRLRIEKITTACKWQILKIIP